MIVTQRDISDFLESWAPLELQLDYDNSGLQIGSYKKSVQRILLCLDLTPQVVKEAIDHSVDLIVAHHPPLFRPLKRIETDKLPSSMLVEALKNELNIYAAHTNLDAATEGVSFALARKLGLDSCSFLQANPDSASGMGVIGHYTSAMSQEAFLQKIGQSLKIDTLTFSGRNEQIRKVAVCGGAGSFLIPQALQMGADAFVTGDLKYHDYFIDESPMLLVDAGHYETEIMVLETLEFRLKQAFPSLTVHRTRVNTNPIQFFHI